jgi:hypothetical protein
MYMMGSLGRGVNSATSATTGKISKIGRAAVGYPFRHQGQANMPPVETGRNDHDNFQSAQFRLWQFVEGHAGIAPGVGQ